MYKVNFHGGDLRRVDNIKTLEECQRECQKEIECVVYTYLPKEDWCYLKHKIEDVRTSNDHVSGWQSCACGQYGAYFNKGPSTKLAQVGNTEICYKICKDNYPCKAWTYDLNDQSCTLYNYKNIHKVRKCFKKQKGLFAIDVCEPVDSYKPWSLSKWEYSSMGYNTNTNAKISGPRNCPGRWENVEKDFL